jgi:hypothetical protein
MVLSNTLTRDNNVLFCTEANAEIFFFGGGGRLGHDVFLMWKVVSRVSNTNNYDFLKLLVLPFLVLCPFVLRTFTVTSLASLHHVFAIWLVAFYYANYVFWWEYYFFICSFFVYTNFFGNADRAENKDWVYSKTAL